MTIGKVLPSSAKSVDNLNEQTENETASATVAPTATEELADDSSSDAAQRTPSTDSAEDFELLDKSVDDLAASTSAAKPKATGSQARGGGKAKKRNNKKR